MAAKKKPTKVVATETVQETLKVLAPAAAAPLPAAPPASPFVAGLSSSTRITSEQFSALKGVSKAPTEIEKKYRTVTRKMSERVYAKKMARNKGSETARWELLGKKASKGEWKAPSLERSADEAFKASGYPIGFRRDYMREFMKAYDRIINRPRSRVRGVSPKGEYTTESR